MSRDAETQLSTASLDDVICGIVHRIDAWWRVRERENRRQIVGWMHISIHTHTHTHTHIYIYIYIYICYVYIRNSWFRRENCYIGWILIGACIANSHCSLSPNYFIKPPMSLENVQVKRCRQRKVNRYTRVWTRFACSPVSPPSLGISKYEDDRFRIFAVLFTRTYRPTHANQECCTRVDRRRSPQMTITTLIERINKRTIRWSALWTSRLGQVIYHFHLSYRSSIRTSNQSNSLRHVFVCVCVCVCAFVDSNAGFWFIFIRVSTTKAI